MNYLRIGSHDSVDEARQQAINIKASYANLLDAAFVIRQAPKVILSISISAPSVRSAMVNAIATCCWQ